MPPLAAHFHPLPCRIAASGFYDWMLTHLDHKGLSFEGQRNSKRDRLGVVFTTEQTAA
jgi:hypothetical protein